MEINKDKVIRKISFLKKRLSEYDAPLEKYSIHGYRSIGQLEGKISAWEDVLDLLNT